VKPFHLFINVGGKMDKAKRKNRSRKGLFISVLFAVAILLFGATMQSGIVQAEEEVVREHGDKSARLIPSFESVTYVVGERVLHAQQWDELGDWELDDTTQNDAIIQSHVNLTSTSESAEVSSDDVTLGTSSSLRFETRLTGNQTDDSWGSSGRLLSLETEDHDIWFEYDGSDLELKYEDEDGNEQTETLGSYDDEHEDGYIRLSVILDEDKFEAYVMDDSYNTIDSHDSEDFGGEHDGVETVRLEGVDGDGTVSHSHFYVCVHGEGQASSGIGGRETDADSWRPEGKHERRIDVNMEDANVIGDSTSDYVWDSHGVDRDNVSDIEDSGGAFHSTDAIHYAIQTGDDEGELGSQNAYWQGWDNTRVAVENALIKHIAEVEDTNVNNVAIIDYLMDDFRLASRFEEDMADEVRGAFADALLNTAEERGWSIITEETDGFETVDELLMRDDFAKMEIGGHTRYGHPDMLQEWEESLTVHQYSLNGMRFGGDSEELWIGWDSPRRVAGSVAGSVASGEFGVSLIDTPDFPEMPDIEAILESANPDWGEIGEIIDDVSIGADELESMTEGLTEGYSDIMTDVREMTVGQTQLFGEQISGIQESYERSMTEMTDSFDSSLEALTSVNMEMANMLEGSLGGLQDSLHYQQQLSGEMQTNMMEMQRMFMEDYSEMAEHMFNFMSMDLENELLNPKPAEGGLSVMNTNAFVIVTVIVVVLIVVLIAVGVAYMWNNNNSKLTRDSTKKRK